MPGPVGGDDEVEEDDQDLAGERSPGPSHSGRPQPAEDADHADGDRPRVPPVEARVSAEAANTAPVRIPTRIVL
jgi:hypothetical protein